jgi:hypothetical protein
MEDTEISSEMEAAELIRYLDFIRRDGWHLRGIPDRIKTYEICLATVAKNGCALEDVPEELRTVLMCLLAVSMDGEALRFVPIELRTSEICLEAVRRSSIAIVYVPHECMTSEICFEEIKRNKDNRFILPPFQVKGVKGMSLEEYEEKLLAQYTIVELLTHSHIWFREKGLKRQNV